MLEVVSLSLADLTLDLSVLSIIPISNASLSTLSDKCICLSLRSQCSPGDHVLPHRLASGVSFFRSRKRPFRASNHAK